MGWRILWNVFLVHCGICEMSLMPWANYVCCVATVCHQVRQGTTTGDVWIIPSFLWIWGLCAACRARFMCHLEVWPTPLSHPFCRHTHTLCLSLCISLSVCLSVCLSRSLSVCLPLSVCLSPCLCPCLSLSVCLCLSVRVCLSLTLSPSLCLSLCLSPGLSVSLSISLSKALSLSLFLSLSL